MNTEYALLVGTQVINTSLGVPPSYVEGITAIDISEREPKPSIGWSYDSGLDEFQPPVVVPSDYGTRITKLAFDNRFTDTELVTIELASIDDPSLPKTDPVRQLAANLRVQQRKLMKALFIDLSRPDTRAGVLQMETYGLLAPGRALAILDAPVLITEVPIGT